MINILIKNRLRALLCSMVNKERDGSAKKAGRGRIIAIALLYAFIFLMFASFATSFAVMLGSVLIPIGASWLYFAIFIIATLTVLFIFSIFETKSELFECRDNELLLSMPIKPRDIVAARVCVVLIYNYLEELIIMLPCAIVYAIISEDPIGVIGILTLALFIPLLSTALASVCGWAVARASKFFKKKTFITVIIYLVLLGAYMVGYELLFEGLESFLADTESAGEVARIPLLYYIGGAALLDPIAIISVILASVIPAVIAYYVISKSYIRIVTSTYAVKTNYKSEKIRSKSPLLSLTKKEISYFFSSATYMLNAGLGYVFMVVLGAFLIVKKEIIFLLADMLYLDFQDPTARILPLLTVAILFASSMGIMSGASLSLEGKRLWIIKTIPVDTKTVLMSKALPQIIISLPPTLITSVLVMIASEAPIQYWTFIILVPIAANVFFALFGVTINTFFPKFDFQNEAQVIKQSLSVFIVMMGQMLIAVCAFALTVFLSFRVHPLFNALTQLLLFGALTLIVRYIMIKVSVRVYEKIDA